MKTKEEIKLTGYWIPWQEHPKGNYKYRCSNCDRGLGFIYFDYCPYCGSKNEIRNIMNNNNRHKDASEQGIPALKKHFEELSAIPQTDSVMRNATKEEQKSVDDYIKSISVKMIPVTALEDIKAEINFLIEKCLPNNMTEEYEIKGLKTALNIIDSHISRKEEK